MIGGKGYELMANHKEGWNPEGFRGRYSEVLDRYDFIVGDWGYGQLRLKGFYRDNHPKANRDSAISGLVDYINEYCNFGCAYFVLRKLKDTPADPLVKDILIKEPADPAKEGKEASQSGTSSKQDDIPQLSSRKYQAESAVSKEQPVREAPVKDQSAKDQSVKEQSAKEQSANSPREQQAKSPFPKDRPFKERNRDNRGKEYPNKKYRDNAPKETGRDNQAQRPAQVHGRDGQGQGKGSRGHGPREQQQREAQPREPKDRDSQPKPSPNPGGRS